MHLHALLLHPLLMRLLTTYLECDDPVSHEVEQCVQGQGCEQSQTGPGAGEVLGGGGGGGGVGVRWMRGGGGGECGCGRVGEGGRIG